MIHVLNGILQRLLGGLPPVALTPGAVPCGALDIYYSLDGLPVISELCSATAAELAQVCQPPQLPAISGAMQSQSSSGGHGGGTVAIAALRIALRTVVTQQVCCMAFNFCSWLVAEYDILLRIASPKDIRILLCARLPRISFFALFLLRHWLNGDCFWRRRTSQKSSLPRRGVLAVKLEPAFAGP